MSIVTALLDAVRKEVRAHADRAVLTVRVRVGALRLVVPDIMQNCYAAATRDTALAGSRLELEEVPARARCHQCHTEFPVEDNWFQCPACTAADGELLAGNELDLTGIELADKLS
jgi:hydrogenase nickel incorporation protein HypA/HybF